MTICHGAVEPVRVTGNQRVTPEKLALARKFRRALTSQERSLWAALRSNEIERCHFRRQQVIAGFIVDFYCASARLAVEVDGASHVGTKNYDANRERILAELGITTLRFSNKDVAGNLRKVVGIIAEKARHSRQT